MTQRFLALWATIHTSLWFVPLLIVVACVASAMGLVEFATRFDAAALDRWPRLFGAGAEGSRGMLSTIAGSMITVAGVVFSITIVALSLTSSQYSSRVLRNFIADRSNQAVLGFFVGIYAYCLVVLRTIRSGEEGAFVPSLAVLGAVALAFGGIAVLIYFIHHVVSSVQAAQILANVAADTRRAIDDLFPQTLGEGDPDQPLGEAERQAAACAGAPVVAKTSGYLQRVDGEALLRLACERGIVVRLEYRIGDFVVEGTPVATILPDGPVDASLADALRAALILGPQRTIDQDAAFGIRQIVDIALKALSPGINDTTTAIMCIDRLSSLLVRIANRRFPSPFRYSGGQLRVIVNGATFESMVTLGVEDIRLAARESPAALRRLIEMLRLVARSATLHNRYAALRVHAEALRASARSLSDLPAGTAVVEAANAVLAELSADMRGPRSGDTVPAPSPGVRASSPLGPVPAPDV